ncbi:MAG: DUF1015 domain-containing protein [Acidobacteriota bacterium]
MAIIKPFRAIRYNTQKVKLEHVITEPYDRITPEMQEVYYRRSPYNIVRIILGKDIEENSYEKNKYKRAKYYIDKWLKEEIFIIEKEDSLYFYEQEFRHNSDIKKRIGLIARVKLEDFSSKKVLPHEKTFPKPKEDRLNLIRETESNTEQIFLLYIDSEKKISNAIENSIKNSEVGFELYDEDEIKHRLCVLKNKENIEILKNLFEDKVLIIADGHHRYETSLNYKKELKMKGINVENTGFDYIMMTLFDIDDPGLVILPTYRLVKGFDLINEPKFKGLLSKYFNLEEIKSENPLDINLLNKINDVLRRERIKHIFCSYFNEFKKFIIFKLNELSEWEKEMDPFKSPEWKKLDISILHSLVIEKMNEFSSEGFSIEKNVNYIRNREEGIKKVINKEYQGIFLLNPVSLEEIKKVVENGEIMPEKSTDFYPKLKSGILINCLFINKNIVEKS